MEKTIEERLREYEERLERINLRVTNTRVLLNRGFEKFSEETSQENNQEN